MRLPFQAFDRERVQVAWWANEDPAQRVGYLGWYIGSIVKERCKKKRAKSQLVERNKEGKSNVKDN